MTEQAFFTLGEAAKQVGKSKATLSEAIKSGKLSVHNKTADRYSIAASELFRVYPPNSSAKPTAEQNRTRDAEQVNTTENGGTAPESAELRARMEILEKERDRERRQLESTIDDLRRRLDQEGEERRRLTMLLADQRERAESAERSRPNEIAAAVRTVLEEAKPKPRPGLFTRLFSRSA